MSRCRLYSETPGQTTAWAKVRVGQIGDFHPVCVCVGVKSVIVGQHNDVNWVKVSK